MKVYLIPGLGFDERIFSKIDLSSFEVGFLNWIEPLSAESIKSYAVRLAEGIDDDLKDVVIVGHSLGGILAQEIAQIRSVKKVVLISSIKSRKELPLHFKVVSPLRIHRLFSKTLTTKTIKYWGKYYDYETPEAQALVCDMVNKQSGHYLTWALKNLSTWSDAGFDAGLDTQVAQIHGVLDKTFPIKLIEEPFVSIKDAGHFMVYNEPEVIGEWLVGELSG